VRLDDPADGFRGEIGERLAVGLDLEWEVESQIGDDTGRAGALVGSLDGAVFGELLVGRDRITFDGKGVFVRARGEHEWVTTAGVQAEFGGDGLPTSVTIHSGRDLAPIEVLGMAAIPISRDGQRPIRLVRVLGRWTGDDGAAKVGWVDLVEPS
jgi:hypothetical protein